MEFKNLTEKVKIPALGLGTWKMGGRMWPDTSEDRKNIEAIQYAIQKGLTHLDTAELYGRGHAEELVAEAIKNIEREKLFITSKVSPNHLSYDGVLKSLEGSLKRLKVDYLDLYLIHWPNPFANLAKTMPAFDKLIEEGKIKFIGVSNFSAKQIQDAQKYLKNKIVCNQVKFSLDHREAERGLLAFCEKEGIILTAYSPLSKGILAESKNKALQEVAKRNNKTLVQVALRWLLDKPQVITIPKASSKEHIDEILGSLGWNLSTGDKELLDQYF